MWIFKIIDIVMFFDVCDVHILTIKLEFPTQLVTESTDN